MIDHIRGTICRKEPNLVVLACGGIGYACRVSLQTAGAIGGVDEEALLYTRMTVREDEIALYGFSTIAERSCYDQLTSITGVGAKAALAILSDLSPDRFALAAAAGDYKAFTKIKGIGTKTAQRIVLELKDKVAKTVEAAGIPAVQVTPVSGNTEEALSALMVLGYTQGEAASALSTLDASLPAAELIRLSLMQLGKNLL